MADKAISELTAAAQVTPTDLFVLEQNGTAKKLTGQILENWLVSFADGHGGIQSIVKTGTSGLVDTYTVTLADTTAITYTVTNGNGISSIVKESVSGLVDIYKITYTDGTSQTFTVTNGAKGDTGDAAYVWVKYASQEPTEDSHSFGDIPDNWMGVYAGTAETAPADWTLYKWFQIKGEKGDPGAPATLESSVAEYLASDSGTVVPSGSWTTTVPAVAQGKYLWTRVTQTFNTGSPVISYSVSRIGKDGLGSVVTVNQKSPDSDGNVNLSTDDIGAAPLSYALQVGAPRNLLDNSDFTKFIAQAGVGGSHGSQAYAVDRWILDSGAVAGTANSNGDGYSGITLNGTIRQKVPSAPAAATAAIGMVSGTASIAYSGGEVTITSSGGVIQWAALYEGEYTAETMPAYQPKGFAAELAECMRYFVRFGKSSQNNHIGYAQAATSAIANAVIALTVPMRIQNPTAAVTGTLNLRLGATDLAVSSLSVNAASSGPFAYIAMNASGLTSGQTYAVRLVLGTLDLSADL